MMNETNVTSGRLMSVDVLRGLTLAAMLLVNNPGTWNDIYPPLRHAAWNGWTFTDLVFPSFLFIVGTSIVLSFTKRLARGDSKGLLLLHALRRAVVLFVIGMLYTGFPRAHVFEPDQNQWQLLISFVLIILGMGFIWPDEGAIAQKGWGRVSWRVILAILLAACGIYAFVHQRALFAPDFRLPGVLQRIAICYFFASLIVIYFGTWSRVLFVIACLVGYWAIVQRGNPTPGFTADLAHPPDGLLHEWIDQAVFGTHLYSERPDPEGLLSTIPSIATTLLGVLAGGLLMRSREEHEKSSGLVLWGILLFASGLILDHWIPINKKLWTSSYVLLAGGISLYLLGLCYAVVDVEGWRRWAKPFLILGSNTIAVYVVAGITASSVMALNWPGRSQSIKAVIFENIARACDQIHVHAPEAHSLVYGLLFVVFWTVVFWPLYRARIFIRV